MQELRSYELNQVSGGYFWDPTILPDPSSVWAIREGNWRLQI